MKRIMVFLLVVTMCFSAVTFTASASESELPKLIYEPFTMTVKTRSQAVVSVTASGDGLKFSWLMQTSEDGKDHTFDFTKDAGIKAFEALDSEGKMKVSFKTEDLGDKKVRHQLIIDNIIEFNYGAKATCTVANDAGYKNCDPAYVYTRYNAPMQMDLQLIAEFAVRREKLVKLAANALIPNSAEYDFDDLEFNWYESYDGTKDNSAPLDEHGPVLMADAYATSPGPHAFYCGIYIRYGITDFYYETGVTHMKVYDPQNIVTFDKEVLTLNEDQEGTVNMTVTVDPESDRGELTYQWAFGYSPDDMSILVPGENGASMTLMGPNVPSVTYYTCIVTNTTDDNCKYDNLSNEMPYVKVVFTGMKGAKITEQPHDAEVTAGEDAVFSVKAEKAISYLWYVIPSDSDFPVALDGASTSIAEGVNTDTLTIHTPDDLTDFNYTGFFCEIEEPSGTTLRTNIASLTVKEAQRWDVPEVIGVYPQYDIKAYVGDDLTLRVDAKAPDGAHIDSRWFMKKNGADDSEKKMVYSGLEYKPDTSVEGIFDYELVMVSAGEGRGESEYKSVLFRVVYLPAETGPDSTADESQTGAVTSDGGESARSSVSVITVVLAALIGVLTLALAGVGIYVLVKNKKKK